MLDCTTYWPKAIPKEEATVETVKNTLALTENLGSG